MMKTVKNHFVWLLLATIWLVATRRISADDTPKVIWYATLESGLAEAKRSDRPILLISAAPHCTGVSGIW